MVRPASAKPLTAAVSPETDSAAPIPVSLVKIKASFVLLKVSSILRPCLENSKAASAAVSRPCEVFLATENKSCPNFSKFSALVPKTTLMSVNIFSTLVACVTNCTNV